MVESLLLFVTSGTERTVAVAAVHAAAELIGCRFRMLSFWTGAQVEHRKLSE